MPDRVRRMRDDAGCSREGKIAGRPIGRLLASYMVVSLAGCTGDVLLGKHKEDPSALEGSCRFLEAPTNEDREIKVGTFWREKPDAEGFDYLESRATDQGGIVTVTNYTSRQDLLTGLAERPVDVFQVNGGSDVLQFVIDPTLPRVCPLDALEPAVDIRRNYFRATWEPMSCHGSIYALPLNVHRLNTVMVNLNVYERLVETAAREGTELPSFSALRSADELFELLELARELSLRTDQGGAIVPLSLCIGSDPGGAWPLAIVAFENLLASYAGAAYEAIWRAEGDLSRSEKEALVRRVAADLRRLRPVSNLGDDYDFSCRSAVNESLEEQTWQGAAELVRTGEALLTIGGDWLRGLVGDDEWDYVQTFPFPGQEKTFVYTPDTFAAQYLKETDGSAARFWLVDVLSQPDTQVRFARTKQAIPASSQLSETEIEELGSEYLSGNYRQFRDCHDEDSDCRLLLAVSGLSPAAGTRRCFDQLGMILATIMGVQYSSEEWRDFEEGCGREKPNSPEEAEDALVELLLQVSEAPYAAECRQ